MKHILDGIVTRTIYFLWPIATALCGYVGYRMIALYILYDDWFVVLIIGIVALVFAIAGVVYYYLWLFS